MQVKLPNCWEIMQCGREAGGANLDEHGVCIAFTEGLGHSCWAIAGTLCGGEVQGSVAQKIGYCTTCAIHKLYNRSRGSQGKEVIAMYPEEESKYIAMMLKSAQAAS